MPGKFTLNKFEKLKSQKIIEAVFAKGKSVYKYPIKLYYLPLHEKRTSYPAHAAFTAPKKKFKRAVDRNLIKRRMREAYRLHKYIVYDELADGDMCFALIFVYTGKEICKYQKIEKTMTILLSNFRDKLITLSDV